MVLVFYVTMLFVYYLLARNEDSRIKEEQPGAYAAYMTKTWMFLPGEPGAWLFRKLFGWVPSRTLGLWTCYLIVLAGSIVLDIALRSYSLEQLSQTRIGGLRLVSVYPRPVEKLADLYWAAHQSPLVAAFLQETPSRLVYVMPGDFFLTGLILEEGPRYATQVLERYPHLRSKPQQSHTGRLVKFFRLGYKFLQKNGSSRRVYDYERLVFVKTLDVNGRPGTAHEAFRLGVPRLPELVVDIDVETLDVLYVARGSGNNAWGQLPMSNL